MREVLSTLDKWHKDGRQFALATVVRTRGSAPREVGSVMGVRDDGLICGSVSGGCIEGAVIEACLDALKAGDARELKFPRGSDEVGLMCGGHVDVWVDPGHASRDWDELVSLVSSDLGCVLATRMNPFAQTLRRPDDAACCSPLDSAVQQAFENRRSQIVDVAGEEWFMHVLVPRPRLVIIGAVHIARALIVFAKEVGFVTVVIDPRTAFAQDVRFDVQPDSMVADWPQEALAQLGLKEDTYAVALTHDPKIDDAAIEIFLNSNVAYVGALGSKTTQEKRKAALREKGLSEEQLARIHGPVGLDIEAETPEEIALAVMAEIVKVRRARG